MLLLPVVLIENLLQILQFNIKFDFYYFMIMSHHSLPLLKHRSIIDDNFECINENPSQLANEKVYNIYSLNVEMFINHIACIACHQLFINNSI